VDELFIIHAAGAFAETVFPTSFPAEDAISLRSDMVRDRLKKRHRPG